MRKRFIENSMNGKKRIQMLFWFVVCILMVFPGKPASLFASQIQDGRLLRQNIYSQYLAKGMVTTPKTRSISLNANDEQLLSVLKRLAKKSRVGISYQREIIPAKNVTVHLNDVTVYYALHSILKGTQLEVILPFTKDVLVIKKKPVKLEVQKETVSGTVTDAATGQPLIGVSILMVGTSTGTTTNVDGHYNLSVSSLQDSLRFSYIGYKTQTVAINGRATVDVAMESSIVGLGQLVVTGFGKESKIQYTGSASTVDVSKAIENVPVSNVGQALQGSVPGVNMRFNSGTPGSSVTFNIRGVSSINAGGKPLIVLNGTPIATGSVGFVGLRATSSSGILSSIDPQTIKSISVLKGPVATSQYGAQGANGVVVITTKNGVQGPSKFSANYQVGTTSLATPYPKMVTAKQAAMLYREAVRNAAEVKNQPIPDNIPIPGGWDGHSSTNWADIVTRDNPITQQFNISASGGSKIATYYGSLSYQNAKGVYIATGFKRFGGSFNFKYNFNDHVNISNHFTISHSRMNGNAEGAGNLDSPVAAPVFIPSTKRAYNEDGSINLDISGMFNPLWIAKNDLSRFQNNRLVNNTALNIDLLKNLSFNAKLGIDYSGTFDKRYQNPVYGRGAKTNGYDQDGFTRLFNGTLDYGFHYIWNINDDNTLNARLIGTSKIYKYRSLIAAGQGFAANGLIYLASASTPVTATSSIMDGKLLSFLGKVHYSYKDKLFFDGTLRREGNSRFSKNFRWGTFYGVGVGWLISSEAFLRDNDVISKLKVRVDFGEAGNNDIGRNEYQALLGYSASYDNQGGIIPIQLGNNRLTWERKRSVEAGLDFGFLGRINGSLTYFHSKTHDLLYSVPISRTTSFSSQLTNIGAVMNRGIEVSLNADIIKARSFLLNLNGSFTYVTNEIKKLPEGVDGNPLKITTGYKRIAAVGHPVGEWYMKTWAGVDPENGNPLWKLNDGSGGVTSNFEDANRAYQGATGVPTHYGSVGLTINYKGFFAGGTLYGSFGNKISASSWAYYYQSDGHSMIPGFTSAATQLKRWQHPGDITDVPRRIAGGNNQSNARNSSRYLYNGSFLRLRTVRLGYNFPVSLLEHTGLRGIKIYLIGQNIWTYKFDPDLIWDPQVGNSGMLSLFSQVRKSYNIGIQIQF